MIMFQSEQCALDGQSDYLSRIIKKAKTNDKGFIDLHDCSSIGVQDNYQTYITQPKEISPYAAFGSFILGTSEVEYPK